jgi:outer membrane lipoprotein-sorting protein
MHHVDDLLATRLSRRAAMLLAVGAVVPAVMPRLTAAQDQDARPLLQQTATAMAAVQSFHFEMSTPSGKSMLANELELAGIEGDVQRPDRFKVTFTAKASIVSLTVKVIGIGTQIWVTDPMSRDEKWIQVSGGDVGDIPLPDILNPDRLLQAAVDVIQEPKIAGEDDIDGTKTTRVEGLFDPKQVNRQVTDVTGTPVPELGALTGDKVIPVTIWIDEANHVRRVEFAGPLTAADQGDVVRRFDLTKIDEPVDIQPPA